MNKSITNKSSQSSADKKSVSGKKLIQARLPFKVLSATDTESSKSETRKRRLSYSPEHSFSTNKQIKQDNNFKLKENVHCIESDQMVISDTESLPDIEKDDESNTSLGKVIEILDILDETQSSPTTSSNPNKLTIKLPLISKKKRKRSKNSIRNPSTDSGSSDAATKTEEINPLKKTTIFSKCEVIPTIDLDEEPEPIIENQIHVPQLLNKSITNISTENNNQKNLDRKRKYLIESEIKCNDKNSEIKKSPNTEKSDSTEKICLDEDNVTIVKLSPSNKDSKLFSGQKDIVKNKRKEIDEQKRKEKEEQRRKEREEKEEIKRKEKEEKEELKRKEKEEKEEIKRKEKEERDKKKVNELEVKNEEKRLREDEKRKKEEQREEERKKREDEKRKKELEKEEAESKKRKAAEAFTNFFKKSKAQINTVDEKSPDDTCGSKYCAFMPFQIKDDMKLAPRIRKMFTTCSKNQLDNVMTNNCEVPVAELYLDLLRTRKYSACKSNKVKHEDIDDVILIDENLLGVGETIKEVKKLKDKYRAKYFHFKENRRPPYFGTWRKTSAVIGPRKPFIEDKLYFDYDVDSDDEWEEEEPGESLHGSDDEKESEDEYEVDNDFFVPHGHLSDEELQNEDETDQDNSPESQKAKLKLLQQEFAKEMKKKTEKIKPGLIGIIWVDENGNQPVSCPNPVWEILNKFAMIPCTDFPLIIENEINALEAGTSTKQNKRIDLPEKLITHLIQLVHGNRHKKKFLIHEFQAFVAEKLNPPENAIKYSKAAISEKIHEISKWTVVENNETKKKSFCRFVSPDILKLYKLENISKKNEWNYILPPSSTHITISEEKIQQTKKNSNDNNGNQVFQPKKSADIKQFTKIITKDKNLSLAHTDGNSEKPIIKSNSDNGKTIFDTEKCVKVSSPIPTTNTLMSEEQLSKERKSENNDGENDTFFKPIVKKRVPILMSVPRGQSIPESFKNEIRNSFLENNKSNDVVTSKLEDNIIPNISEGNNLKSEISENNTLVSKSKVINKEDPLIKINQNNNINTESFKKDISLPKVETIKKRVPLLLSVPIGQAIPETLKNDLITSFLKKEKSTKNEGPEDSVIVID